MANINNLRTTVLLIKGSLFPVKQSDFRLDPPENSSRTNISPDAFSAAFAEIDNLLRPDGTLELYFAGALSAAAPFLLYRLKSAGFSGCRVLVNSGGILLTARR